MSNLPNWLHISPRVQDLQDRTADIRNQIINHSLFSNIHTLEDVQILMGFHVFAVWDFMSLLKTLQLKLTGVSLPWMPTFDPLTRRLINQIVLMEESDLDQDDAPISHFELYLRAMKSCGADTTPIDTMMAAIRKGEPFKTVITTMQLPWGAFHFLKNTWDLVDKAPIHEVAAVFALAREGLIPDMFTSLTDGLENQFQTQLSDLHYYLDRHKIEDEDHAQMSFHMLSTLCLDDDQKWEDAFQAVQEALQARLILWDGVQEKIQASKTS